MAVGSGVRGMRWGAALVFLVVAAYVPALRAGFVWDDDDYVTANPTLEEPGGLARIWVEPKASPQYYPMVFTTFWVERRLWGLEAAGYHAVNVALHGVNALLLWRLLARLGFGPAWFAAAIFALHPVQAESVAWVAERKNVLSGLFYLLAVHAYLPLLGVPGDAGAGGGKRGARRSWAAAFACFCLALLSKSVTATLPAALLLIAWWRRGALRRRDVLLTAPFVAVGALAGLFTAWLERSHVGATGREWSFSAVERLVIMGKNFWFYLAKFLWPSALSFSYPRWDPHGYPWWHLAAPLAAAGSVLALWAIRGRLGRGPLAALLFFTLTLGPASGIVDFYPMIFSFVADHFAYLALIGPALAAAGAAAVGARRLPRGAGAAAAGVLLLVLAALTWRRTGAFHDQETLWRDTLARNPAATLAKVNLGVLLAGQQRHEEARALLEDALRAEPGAPDILHSLGGVLLAAGRVQEAEAMLRAAVRAAPRFARARASLANALLRLDRPLEAVAEAREAVRLTPDYPGGFAVLGRALEAAGDTAGAEAAYAQALRRDPRDARSHLELGALLAARGSAGPAREHLERARALAPADHGPPFNLGLLLDGLGDLEGAAAQYREAIRLNPGFAEAHNNLGVDLALLGRPAEAARHFREALRIRPDHPRAAVNLEALEKTPGQDVAPSGGTHGSPR